MLDFELIDALREPVIKGVQTYWDYLQKDDAVCNDLACADIVPLHESAVMKTWWLFDKQRTGRYESIESVLNEFKQDFRV